MLDSELIDYGLKFLRKYHGYSDDDNYIVGMALDRMKRLGNSKKGRIKNYFITCVKSYMMDVKRENIKQQPPNYIDHEFDLNKLTQKKHIDIFSVIKNIDNKEDHKIIMEYINSTGMQSASKKLNMSLKVYKRSFDAAIERVKEENILCLIS